MPLRDALAESPARSTEAEPRFGCFALLRRLGRGGSGEVWLARRESIADRSRPIAVKLVPLAAERRDRADRFEDEVRWSMLLDHPNIVRVHYAGREGEVGYIAMEWVDGLDLGRLRAAMQMRGRPISFQLAAFVVRELLRALAHAHTHPLRLVHRDVSPHNVLIGTGGEVKLADFGLASAMSPRGRDAELRGKLRYMAPEYVVRGEVGPAVDVYAVGAILHELLSGRRFRADHIEAALLSDVVAGRVPPLERPGLPRELERLRRALLAPDPTARPTAERAIAMVEAWPEFRACADEVATWCRSILGSLPEDDPAPHKSLTRSEVVRPLDGTDEAASITRTWEPPPIHAALRGLAFGVGVGLASLAAGALAWFSIA